MRTVSKKRIGLYLQLGIKNRNVPIIFLADYKRKVLFSSFKVEEK
jgi:hypothetical protein